MNYTINRTFEGVSFKDIDARTRAALADNGFGVLTGIDVQETMKKKLDAEMQAIDNVELTAVAGQVRDLLAKAVAAI